MPSIAFGLRPGRGRRSAGPLRRSTRLLLLTALALIATVGPARPAGADPARPTDFESTVSTATPPLPAGASVQVVGGDAFLELTIPRGHTAEVPDYDDGSGDPGPYLRFRSDGTVERNERALATRINESRYGSGGPADEAGSPRWTVVGRDGRYLWHDHRVHWMAPRPPATERGGQVDMGGPSGDWTVDLIVDGVPTVVSGRLILHPAPSVVPWVLVAVTAAAGLVIAAALLARRSAVASGRLLAGALAVASAAALVVGVATWRSVPAPASRGPLTAIVPAVALAASGVALATRRPGVRRTALAAAVAALGGWAWLRRTVLARAMLPTDLPFAVDRSVTASSLGVAVAGAVLLVWAPAPRHRGPTPAVAAGATTEPG